MAVAYQYVWNQNDEEYQLVVSSVAAQATQFTFIHNDTITEKEALSKAIEVLTIRLLKSDLPPL